MPRFTWDECYYSWSWSKEVATLANHKDCGSFKLDWLHKNRNVKDFFFFFFANYSYIQYLFRNASSPNLAHVQPWLYSVSELGRMMHVDPFDWWQLEPCCCQPSCNNTWRACHPVERPFSGSLCATLQPFWLEALLKKSAPVEHHHQVYFKVLEDVMTSQGGKKAKISMT